MINSSLAPICLFTYNRLNETTQTVDALKKNFLASESILIIYSDGGKDELSWNKVNSVRSYLRSITGFKSVEIIESDKNKGLANSIISGVTDVIKKYEKVIVLEDDLLTSQNFLNYMNQGLDFYEHNNKIFNISGFSFDLKSLADYEKDFYYGYRASSWGWGTWRNRWETIDWEAQAYKRTLYNPLQHLRFMRGGSDMPLMLWRQMHGKIDSWAIRWCLQQFIDNKFTVFPSISKVESIGFGADATHTKLHSNFSTKLDNEKKVKFNFINKINLSNQLMVEFQSRFSVLSRLRRKITNL